MKETKKDYQMMVEIIKEMGDSLKNLKENVSDQLNNTYNVTEDILDALLPYKKDYIEDMSNMSELRDLLVSYQNKDNAFDDKTDEEIHDAVMAIKNISLMLIRSQKEYENIKNNSTEVMDEYLEYMSSEKVNEARNNRLSSMKELLETETNDVKRKQIERMISTMESAINFDFIKDRFNRFGEKEVENIMEGYFNDKKGSYIITKYNNKIKQFGYNPNIYQYFFNIEETFLPEEYHPFNNLFLFIYMRMIGYSNANFKDDKMFVRSLTGALAELIYHKLDESNREGLINVIKSVLDNFMDHKEFFEEHNTTAPTHPMRIEQKTRHAKIRKEVLMKKLKETKYTGEIPENINIDDLQQIFDEHMENLINDQIEDSDDIIKEYTEENEEITEE